MFKSFPTLVRHCIIASITLTGVILPASALTIKDPLGSAAVDVAGARVIYLTASTTAVNVERHETVRFVNPAGQSFSWHFYTLHHPTMNISDIAPAGFNSMNTTIYVGVGASERH